MGRRLLIAIYGLTGLVVVVTVASLITGFADFWPQGFEVETLMGIILWVLVVGLVGLVDFLRWPRRWSASTRLMSTAVVVISFVGGYLIGALATVEFVDESEIDVVVTVIGPGDPMLSLALAVVMAGLGAILVWLGLGRGEASGSTTSTAID